MRKHTAPPSFLPAAAGSAGAAALGAPPVGRYRTLGAAASRAPLNAAAALKATHTHCQAPAPFLPRWLGAFRRTSFCECERKRRRPLPQQRCAPAHRARALPRQCTAARALGQAAAFALRSSTSQSSNRGLGVGLAAAAWGAFQGRASAWPPPAGMPCLACATWTACCVRCSGRAGARAFGRYTGAYSHTLKPAPGCLATCSPTNHLVLRRKEHAHGALSLQPCCSRVLLARLAP